MKKTFIKILCVLFAFIFSCVNATATEIAVDIKEELTEAFGFPLHFESSYSDETLNAQISLREEFAEVEEYELNVRHWLLGGTILYEKVSGDEIIELYDIDFGHNYSITLTLYYPDRIKYIDGTFAAELSEDGVVFEFEHEQIDDIVNYYNYLDESAEMTDEEYDEVFEYLDIPSFIEKEKAKEFKHLVRIEEFKDSLTTIGFYNSDGTTTVYTFSDPVRYVDTDGTIKDYSADIVPAVESVEQQGYKYSNKFGEMTVNFSDQLSNSSGTEIISKHGTIEFGLFGAQQTQEQTVIDKLFDADINEATLTKDGTAQKIEYEGIGIDGVTIKSEPVIDGAKTSIIMSEVPQDNKIRIWVSTQNLLPIVDDRGRFVNFVDAKTNSILYRFGYVETRDNGNSNNRRFTTNNSVCIVGQNASKVLIEISLDNDFVYSPVVSYPISTDVYLISTEGQYIDYSSETAKNTTAISNRTAASISDINVTSTEASSVYATTSAPPPTDNGYYVTCYYTKETSNIKDISIHSNGNVDAWDSAWLNTGRVTSYWTGTACVNVVSSIVMQYDSTSIEESDVDVDRIKFAEISFYGANSGIEDFTVPVKIERLTESWNESYVNSSLRNKVDTAYIGNELDKVYRNEGEGRFTVTEFVKDHLRYIKDESTGIPNYGIRVVTVDNDAPLLTFASKDHPDASKRPKLLITYEGYVFTPYENTIRIDTNEPHVRLDYEKTYSGIADNLVLLKKSGVPETSNVELEYRSLDEDIATVDENGVVTAYNTKGMAFIEITRTDTGDCTYVYLDIGFHIEISEDDTDYSAIGDADDVESYKITLSGKTWLCYHYTVSNPSMEARAFVAQYMTQLNNAQYFSPLELKYLYILDPQGVVAYVQEKIWDIDSGNTNASTYNRTMLLNSLYEEMYGEPVKWYQSDNLVRYYGPDPTPQNIKDYVSDANLMFGLNGNIEDFKEYFYLLLDSVLIVASVCVAPMLSPIWSSLLILGSSAVNGFMAYDTIKTSLDAGEGVNLGGAIWLVGSLIGVVTGAIKLAKALLPILTKLFESVTIFVRIKAQCYKWFYGLDDVAAYVKVATKNPKFANVMLGKRLENGVSYIEMARRHDATYFTFKNWEKLERKLGKEFLEAVNKAFLEEQISLGKTILLSHNPSTATNFFLTEVNFLKEKGYSFIAYGDIWKAVK